jgi:hypothetical protein
MTEKIKADINYLEKEIPKMFEADRKKAQRELSTLKKMLRYYTREGK